MAVYYLNLSKTTASAASTYTGSYITTQSGRAIYGYSSPSTNADRISATVPEAIRNAKKITKVAFTYIGGDVNGTKKIYFFNTNTTVTNSTILNKLTSGVTSLNLVFSFKAPQPTPGPYPGAGTHSVYCEWKNIKIAVTVDEEQEIPDSGGSDEQSSLIIGDDPAGLNSTSAISNNVGLHLSDGTTTYKKSRLYYNIEKNNIAKDETVGFYFTLVPDQDIDRVRLTLGFNYGTDGFQSAIFNKTENVKMQANTIATIDFDISFSDAFYDALEEYCQDDPYKDIFYSIIFYSGSTVVCKRIGTPSSLRFIDKTSNPLSFFRVLNGARIAPAISNSTITDVTEYPVSASAAREFITNYSQLQIAYTASIGTAQDPLLKIDSLVLNIYDASAAERTDETLPIAIYSIDDLTVNPLPPFLLRPFANAGTYYYTITITDSKEESTTVYNTSADERSFTIYSYTLQPKLSADFSIKRCSSSTDNNITTYSADDQGELVLCEGKAYPSVFSSSISSNPTRLVIKWTRSTEAGESAETTCRGENPVVADAGQDYKEYTLNTNSFNLFSYEYETNAGQSSTSFKNEYDTAATFYFTIILQDNYFSYTVNPVISNSTTLFNIEEYGVGVGMRTKGEVNAPSFDVAYPAYIYDGLYLVKNGVAVRVDAEDTGWQDGTDVNNRGLQINSQTAVDYDANEPHGARRKNGIIYLRGRVHLIQSLAYTSATAHVTIGHLSTEFQPPYPLALNMGTRYNLGVVTIESNGDVELYNFTKDTISAGAHIDLNFSYPAD